jgi:hypothetical protein
MGDGLEFQLPLKQPDQLIRYGFEKTETTEAKQLQYPKLCNLLEMVVSSVGIQIALCFPQDKDL